jgi:hypothetical protein
MDKLCRQRKINPCRSVPVRFEDVQMEGFEDLKMYDISRPYILLGAILILGVGALIIKENL